MDALDDKLIALLKQEPRATNRVLASKLGVSEPTVASRISRLENASQLRVIATVDMTAAGWEHFVVFGLRVTDRHPDQAAAELARISAVTGLTLNSGRYEIVGTVLAQDKRELSRTLDHTIGTIPGVQGLESGLILESHAHASDTATIAAIAQGPQPISSTCSLDPRDLAIIECLQEDGRMSYREVGRRIGSPEATIRSRVRRLEASGTMRLEAVTDVGGPESAAAWIALRVHGGGLASLAQRMTKMGEVAFLGTSLGRFNLLALAVLGDRAALLDFIFEQVAPLHGIQQLETWEVVRIYKHDPRVRPR